MQDYRGYELLSDPLLMPSESMPRQIDRYMEELDPQMGAWHSVARSEYPRMTTEHKWLFKTPEQAWEFRKWLHRQAGRLSPLWVPSRTHDLVMVQNYIEGSEFEVIGTDFQSLGFDAQGMRHVAFFTAQGDVVCASIEEVYESWWTTGNEIIRISDWLYVYDIVMVSFISLHRFEADRISLVWDRPGVGVCNASMISIGCRPGDGGELEEPPE